jgi:hypothetical protein
VAAKSWRCESCGRDYTRLASVWRHASDFHPGESVNAIPLKIPRPRPGPLFHPKAPFADRTESVGQLYQSRIEASEVHIGYKDLRQQSWPSLFSSKFARVFASDLQRNPSRNPAIRKTPEGLLELAYFGFVCPNCHSIGATYEQKTAVGYENGDHFCAPDNIYRNTVEVSGLGTNLGILKQDKEALLRAIVMTIAKGRDIYQTRNIKEREQLEAVFDALGGQQRGVRKAELANLEASTILTNFALIEFLKCGATQKIESASVDTFKFDVRMAIAVQIEFKAR